MIETQNDEPLHPEVHVKLAGRDGNAFAIMAACTQAARKLGVSERELVDFRADAIRGNYDHLLRTCKKWFDVE